MTISKTRFAGRVALPALTMGRPEGRVRIALASLILVAAPVAALRTDWAGQLRPTLALPAATAPAPAPAARLNTLARVHRPVQVTAAYPTGAAAFDLDGGELGRTNRPAAAGGDPLAATLTQIEAKVARTPGAVAFQIEPGGRVAALAPATGWTLDRETTRQRLLDAIAAAPSVGDPIAVEAALTAVPPPDLPESIEARRAGLAKRLAEPLTLRIDGRSIALPSDRWLASLPAQTIAPGDPIRLDRDQFRPLLDTFASHFRVAPVNARLEIRDGRLEVLTPAAAGREVRVEALIDAIEQRLGSADRAIEVPVNEVLPAVRAETRSDLGIREWIGEGATPYNVQEGDRSHNVELAARHLHGLVLAPGEVFSFNRAIGPATTANGYRWGWGIAAGASGPRMVPSEAGGICQVATTLLQAAYGSGLEIVERHPHAFWITKYGLGPFGRQGLDATVDEAAGSDLRFRNTTGKYVLIQAAVREGHLHIQLLGTNPGRQVKVGQPQITNVVKPDYAIVRQPTDRLPQGQEMWLEAAGEGFRSRLTRTITDAQGKVIQQDTLESTYAPSRNVIGVGTGR